MKHQVTHISVHQTAKVFALLYAVLGLLFAPLFLLGGLADPASAIPWGLALAFPLLYGVMGYVFTALFVALYNAVAGRTGGIEITVRAAGDPERFA
jgi:hypothetical protein